MIFDAHSGPNVFSCPRGESVGQVWGTAATLPETFIAAETTTLGHFFFFSVHYANAVNQTNSPKTEAPNREVVKALNASTCSLDPITSSLTRKVLLSVFISIEIVEREREKKKWGGKPENDVQ